jgi:small subunit ribosomal protein S14
MARKASVEKNLKVKRLIKSCKNKRNALKDEIYNKNLSLEERFQLVIKLAKMPRNSASNRFRNRCELTGRPRGVDSTTGLSRNKFRELAGKGQLAGVIKASWS